MKIQITSIFTILFVIICSSLIFAQSSYYRNNYLKSYSVTDYLVSEHEQKLNSDFIRLDSLISASVQGISSKFSFQYNNNSKMSEWLIQDNHGSGWENYIKNNLFYDNQNNLVTEINLGWSTNHWDTLSRANYSYENGMLSYSVRQIYYNNFWENSSRENYEYGTSKNLLNTLSEDWVNNNWQNWLFVTNYYSFQNQRDSILFQTWLNNGWQNDKKTVFYYSENQIDLDSIVVKSWNGFSWTNLFKRELVNDVHHNQIEQIDKEWNAGSWINSIRRFFTYNEFNFIEYVYCEIWVNDRWITGDGDIVFQYPNGFTIGIITNNVSVYYSKIVSVDEKENIELSDYSLSQNYPNPFNPITKICYSIPRRTDHQSVQQVTLKIYDILGNEIATIVNEEQEPGIYTVEFDGSNLSSGIYFYKINTADFTAVKKMILVK